MPALERWAANDETVQENRCHHDIHHIGWCHCLLCFHLEYRWLSVFWLDRAVFTKNRMLVGMLITLGADPNGKDYDGEITPWEPNHPVMSATWNSDPKMIDLIVSRGGEVNFNYGHGFSPLVYAVSHEDIDCVRTLVSLGANPEFLTSEGTAVAIASRLQNPEIIPLLTNTQQAAAGNGR